MDSYNRGYNAGINLTGTQIGNGTIVIDSSNVSLNLNDQAIGFYAIAYSYNGETVISYRGTDNPPSLLAPFTDMGLLCVLFERASPSIIAPSLMTKRTPVSKNIIPVITTH